MTAQFALVVLMHLFLLGGAIARGRFVPFALVNLAVAVSVAAVHYRAVTSPDRSSRFVEAWRSLYGTAWAFTMFLYGAMLYAERSGHSVLPDVCVSLFIVNLVFNAQYSWRSLRAQQVA